MYQSFPRRFHLAGTPHGYKPRDRRAQVGNTVDSDFVSIASPSLCSTPTRSHFLSDRPTSRQPGLTPITFIEVLIRTYPVTCGLGSPGVVIVPDTGGHSSAVRYALQALALLDWQ